MKYFGTSIDDYGHYLWDISQDGSRLVNRNLDLHKLSFNPETVAYISGEKAYRDKGTVQFYKVKGITICYIEGSCKDNRGGTKSVFWVDEDITYNELVNRMLNTSIIKNILDKMAFSVKFNEALAQSK